MSLLYDSIEDARVLGFVSGEDDNDDDDEEMLGAGNGTPSEGATATAVAATGRAALFLGVVPHDRTKDLLTLPKPRC